MEREKEGALFLFKVLLSSSRGVGADREPSCGARGPCCPPCLSSALICNIDPGLMSAPWLSFPALLKTHREVGNGFMIKAELDLYQRSVTVLEIRAT